MTFLVESFLVSSIAPFFRTSLCGIISLVVGVSHWHNWGPRAEPGSQNPPSEPMGDFSRLVVVCCSDGSKITRFPPV